MPLVSVNGKELFISSARGSADATADERITILCIHGLGSAHSFYTPLAPEVTGSGYDLVAYDTYGTLNLPSDPTALAY